MHFIGPDPRESSENEKRKSRSRGRYPKRALAAFNAPWLACAMGLQVVCESRPHAFDHVHFCRTDPPLRPQPWSTLAGRQLHLDGIAYVPSEFVRTVFDKIEYLANIVFADLRGNQLAAFVV